MTDEPDEAEEAVADEGEGEDVEDGEGAGKKSGKKKLILFAVIGIVVLAGAGAGVYFSGCWAAVTRLHRPRKAAKPRTYCRSRRITWIWTKWSSPSGGRAESPAS